MSNMNKRETIIISCVLLVISLLNILNIHPGHDWGDDFAHYIMHARNIAEGRPYSEIGYIFNPDNPIAPPTYPPVLPLLLSLLYAVWGTNLFAMKMLMVVFFVSALLVLFCLLGKRLPFALRVCVVVITACYPWLFRYTNHVLSDLPFMCFVFLSLWGIDAFYREGAGRKNLAWIAVAGAMFVAIATRGIGIVLLPALVILDVVQFRRIHRQTAYIIGVCVLLLFLQEAVVPAKGYYFRRIISEPAVYFKNVTDYAYDLYGLARSQSMPEAALVILNCLAVVGFYCAVRKKITIIETFCVCYMAALLGVHLPGQTGFDTRRYLFVLIPFFYYYISLAIEAIPTAAGRKVSAYIFIAVAGTTIGWYTFDAASLDVDFSNKGAEAPAALELYSFIRNATTTEDVFVFAKPRVLALYTGRKAAVNHQPKDSQALLKYFRSIHATYIVVRKQDDGYLRRLIRKIPGSFESVYFNQGFHLYRILSCEPRA